MNITIVTGTFHPEIGGPPRYLYALSEELGRLQDEVRIVAFSPLGKVNHPYPFLVRHISRRFFLPLRMGMMAYWTFGWGKRCDLLYVNDYGLPPVLTNIILRRPLVMKIVGDFAWEYSVRHRLTDLGIDEFQKTQHRLLQKLQRFYVSRADRIIVPSNYLAKIVAGWGIEESKIRVIFNAVSPNRYIIPQNKEEAKSALGLSGRNIVTVGRLTPWKGMDTLISLLPLLPPDVRLVIVGDGPIRPFLENLAREKNVGNRVSFVRDVPESHVTIYLKAADCMVLYTGYEGLSHVLLEALMAGVPIVASAKGGNVELIRDCKDGILVPYGDTGRLKEAIENVLQNSVLAMNLAESAKQRSNDFGWESLVTKTRSVFQEVVKQSSQTTRNNKNIRN